MALTLIYVQVISNSRAKNDRTPLEVNYVGAHFHRIATDDPFTKFYTTVRHRIAIAVNLFASKNGEC